MSQVGRGGGQGQSLISLARCLRGNFGPSGKWAASTPSKGWGRKHIANSSRPGTFKRPGAGVAIRAPATQTLCFACCFHKMGLHRVLTLFVFSPLWVIAVRYTEEFDQYHRLRHRVESRQRVNASVKNTEVPEELNAVVARSQKAKTLLDATLQKQADAKAKGVMLSTEDRHALSDVQQDAATAQKEMHEILARVDVNTATLPAAQSEVKTASSPPQEKLTTAQQRFEKANQMLEVKLKEKA